jgi:hypothetical protein
MNLYDGEDDYMPPPKRPIVAFELRKASDGMIEEYPIPNPSELKDISP